MRDTEETGLDFPREWIEFPDPDDSDTIVRADLTWLLSRWTCIFGQGCPGIDAENPDDGCCVHGAFFTEADDEERVRKAAAKLTPETWQNYRADYADVVVDDTLADDDGVEQPARKTATVDGACVFHNRPGFSGGMGCALHAQALRDGVHPLKYKPEVCWQVPVKRDYSTVERADGSVAEITWIGEFDRRAWGAGGHDFDWWCASAPSAHVGAQPVYRSYEAELIELIGKGAYAKLAELCAERERIGQLAVHPATRKALPLTVAPRPSS
ncbi:hypothetical protein [Stackebrandtia nassauensis]|uniref:DUF3109 family protein n=1 Tax=Stackebrandtia nassauensis (strain DSM 44728 / CIP 108903 / NRRL B-16338 / NBRC 102104 / LLR-40K-21) TaxID=446470 RepID=D3PY58_STANL|nr:hypothetical protein [Stackebrandtia nassauensis]ADD45387.1 hypothetical protein Snas_5757 [Stackebrandtia nassauensis DSM 44728]